MMQWERATDPWDVNHPQHLGLKPELVSQPIPITATLRSRQRAAATDFNSCVATPQHRNAHSHVSTGVSWQEQQTVSLGTPAVSEAMPWMAAWGRMAVAQGSSSPHSARASPAPSSALTSRPFSPAPPSAARTTTACTSRARRRPPEISLSLSVGSPELPASQLSRWPLRKTKTKRAVSEVVGGCSTAQRRKAQPAHTVALGESRKHICARLVAPPAGTFDTPPPAVTLHDAPDRISTTSLPQLAPPAQQQRPLALQLPALPLPAPSPMAMQSLSPFAAFSHLPLSTPRDGDAAAARQRTPEREELWLAGGAGWQPPAAPGGASGWQDAAQAELLACMDAAEEEALNAALETLNEMLSPSSFWL